MKGNRKTFAVDFDGTLAHYDGWQGIEHCGAPITEMVNRVRQWLAEGHEVFILTARLCASEEYSVRDRDKTRAAEVVQDWCEKYIGKRLRVTSEKGGFDEFWEDKAVQVIRNTGLSLHEHFEDILWRLYRTAQVSRNHQMMGEVHNAIHESRKLVDEANREG